MSLFHKRLAEAVERSGASKAAISQGGGLNRDTLGKLLSDTSMSPTIATVEKLAHGIAVATGGKMTPDPAFLAFGLSSAPARGVGAQSSGRDAAGLRVLGEVAAGVWIEADADRAAGRRTSIQTDPRFPSDAQYLLQAVGTSMNAVIQPDDLILCVDVARSGLDPKDGEIVIVERRRASGEREVSAKRLVMTDAGVTFRADSHDPQWNDYFLSTDLDDGDEIAVTAVVLRALREFR